MLQKVKTEGVSLRAVHNVLIILAVLVSAILIYRTFHLSSTFYRLSEATDESIALQKAAYELMDGSDILTEQVRRFVHTGDPQYMEAYFHEAKEARHRDEALEIVGRIPDSDAALRKLQSAMDESVRLMDVEYYAMKLVIEAEDIKSVHDEIRDVVLSPEDEALSAAGKMEKAGELVNGDEYYESKKLIHDRMIDSVAAIEDLTHSSQSALTGELRHELHIVRVIIIAQAIGILFMIWLTARLGINPVLEAVDKIKEDSPIPVVGANEFRYLARTYNKMYGIYKRSLENLNFKASHDELTGVYNRAGYDLLVTSIDLNNTFMLMIDVDHFKQVNDEFGHEMGDKVLKKVAYVIKSSFRSDDYVCRIGGDEFVVLMVHTEEMQKDSISAKSEFINKRLEVSDGYLPPVSVSVGVAHGSVEAGVHEMFNQADNALYHTKKNGRCGITFYDDIAPQPVS